MAQNTQREAFIEQQAAKAADLVRKIYSRYPDGQMPPHVLNVEETGVGTPLPGTIGNPHSPDMLRGLRELGAYVDAASAR